MDFISGFSNYIHNVPSPHQINDAVVVFPAESNIPPVYIYAGYPGKIYLDEKDTRDEQDKEFNQVKDAVKFTAAFYKETFNVYGEKAEQFVCTFLIRMQ